MFRHVVLFGWRDDASEEQKQRVRRGLAELADTIPEVRALRFGDDAGLRDDNFDLALVVDFDDEDGYRRYAEDAGHQQFVAEQVRPVLARRAAVQHTWSD